MDGVGVSSFGSSVEAVVAASSSVSGDNKGKLLRLLWWLLWLWLLAVLVSSWDTTRRIIRLGVFVFFFDVWVEGDDSIRILFSEDAFRSLGILFPSSSLEESSSSKVLMALQLECNCCRFIN